MNDYTNYAESTGHAADCAWVQWVIDGKFYPNPGCTCYRQVPVPKRAPWWKRIRFHKFYASWLWTSEDSPERMLLFGVAGGRVSYEPEAEYLYSLRVFLLIGKIELLWTI